MCVVVLLALFVLRPMRLNQIRRRLAAEASAGLKPHG